MNTYLHLGGVILAGEEILKVIILIQRLLGQQIVILCHCYTMVLRSHSNPCHLHRVLEISLDMKLIVIIFNHHHH